SVDRLVVDRALLRLELDLDALQRSGGERELVGVGVADARERIAADVERRPRDEPARAARDARLADRLAVDEEPARAGVVGGPLEGELDRARCGGDGARAAFDAVRR